MFIVIWSMPSDFISLALTFIEFVFCYRAVLIILELSIIKKGSEIGFKIGNPQSLTADSTSTQQASTNGNTAPQTNGNSSAIASRTSAISSGGKNNASL